MESTSPTVKSERGDAVWGKLPDALTENILARLPIPILAQSRLVCKNWNSIILSDALTELRSQNNPVETWFLISWKPQKSIVVYDPSSRHWHEMPAHSLIAGDSQILGTAGGLLFVVSYFKCSSGGTDSEGHWYYEDFQFTVCNPLTGSWRKISCNNSVLDIYIVGMTYNHQSNSYIILLCGSSARGKQYLATEVYESSTDCWTDGDDFILPESETHFEFVQREAVCVDGFFFCLLNDTVHAYDLQRGKWTPLPAKVPPTDAFISLLGCCSGLLMVTELAPLQLSPGDASLPFRIWELEQSTMKWVEKQMAPPSLSNTFFDPGWHEDYYVFGQGEWLCLWTLEEDFRAFAYDCSRKQWHQLPRSHLLEGLDWLDNLCGMPFEPSFKARV
ncbi:hypothetical protein O6H91_10G050100 [Diphasiastrum complanatum]|uniref:Uncharacterized protein n=4 Tax=Diphasiastrum complanatum TaxID=34168 RepID=A0ACC2CH93_DIPCM|nr:hypothetical protein O6H91_10G050100 [Diphasiastrum complanatum]KAJ7541207.1 hypothetical protein O6H91_10G050100 [Diphasiastrum complanatum]KAJ7541208.1 hypothetical protein O6H91_10G050100 [Diphasiastrum complanatum]KAJ7541209.1 hypothetical protein O6H91_10G050100 [Diphasiastrum complanatum]